MARKTEKQWEDLGSMGLDPIFQNSIIPSFQSYFALRISSLRASVLGEGVIPNSA
jgi:hypothetical protein